MITIKNFPPQLLLRQLHHISISQQQIQLNIQPICHKTIQPLIHIRIGFIKHILIILVKMKFLQSNQKLCELPKYSIYPLNLCLYQFDLLNIEPILITEYQTTSTMKSHAIILIRQHIESDMEVQPYPTFTELIGNRIGPEAIKTFMNILKAGKGLIYFYYCIDQILNLNLFFIRINIYIYYFMIFSNSLEQSYSISASPKTSNHQLPICKQEEMLLHQVHEFTV
ncbi:unnamed protein product [Paramecium primaurelia]|uniref:Uncharacterized protein n=1 Tax=Paramecium primaurelia TaxID=5886 RepID=A0A8S1NK18_PARPR|nr:unnamed protein product [Paramecium primaurelia]